MTPETEDRLHRAIWSHHDALQRREGFERRARREPDVIDLRDRIDEAARGVEQARLALFRILVADGWNPPPLVAHALA